MGFIYLSNSNKHNYDNYQRQCHFTLIYYYDILSNKSQFEIRIIVKAIYLNLEFHRVFRVMSLIALYIVHVTYRYVKTKFDKKTILSSYKNMSGLLDSINDVLTVKKKH